MRRNVYSIAYWLFFAVTQTVGMILPRFANIHSNPTPLFLGVALLIPGSLLATFFPEGTNQWVQVPLIVLVNAGVWYIYRRFMRTRPER